MNGKRSAEWAERLRAVIPWGSSTCSKSPRLLPDEPGVIVRGEGCRVWDADGREFIDYRSALGPVTLGYRYPAVDDAIRRQMESGIVFGHPHPLEGEVAELLCDVIP
jgi:glutamate-1-semialdehyde 2,1-aminomutase